MAIVVAKDDYLVIIFKQQKNIHRIYLASQKWLLTESVTGITVLHCCNTLFTAGPFGCGPLYHEIYRAAGLGKVGKSLVECWYGSSPDLRRS